MPCAVAFPDHVSQVWLVLAAGALLLPISSFPVEGLLHILPGRCWRTARNSYGVRFDSPFSAQPACSAWIDAFSLAAGGCDEVTARIFRIGTSVSGGFFPRRESVAHPSSVKAFFSGKASFSRTPQWPVSVWDFHWFAGRLPRCRGVDGSGTQVAKRERPSATGKPFP